MEPHERLAAFEAEHLGEDVPRQNGKIEKGHGSLFHRNLTEQQKHHHAAIERLIDAEQHMMAARAKLQEAEHKHAEAQTKVEAHEAEVAATAPPPAEPEHLESESVRRARDEAPARPRLVEDEHLDEVDETEFGGD